MEQCADQPSLTRVLQLLRCPRCCELPPAGPIYACERGHTLCGRCYEHLEKEAEPDEQFRCVVCHARLGDDRNMLAEQLVRSLGKRALARTRQRVMGLDDGNVRVVSDHRPRLVVVHSSSDSAPVTLPPPPPPAPLPAPLPPHRSRQGCKPSRAASPSHEPAWGAPEMPCCPGCMCPRCSALLAFYAAWLPPDAQTAARGRPLPLAPIVAHAPPPPPSSPPSPPSPLPSQPLAPETSSRELSPAGFGTTPAYHCPPPHGGSRHTFSNPTASRSRTKAPDEDNAPSWRPPSSQSSPCRGYSSTLTVHHGESSASSSLEPITVAAAPYPTQPERLARRPTTAYGDDKVRNAFHPLCGGDATAFACGCRCACCCSCPCTAVKSLPEARPSMSSVPGYPGAPKDAVERRVPTMRPVRCPKPSCGSLLAASAPALVAHFAFDHSDVPLLPVDPGDETQLWLSSGDIPLEMAKVQALLLLPLHSSDRCSLRSTGEPLVSRYGLRRPLPLLTGRCRMAAEAETTTDTGEETAHATPSSPPASSAPFAAASGALVATDEITSIHKEDTLVMWLADVDGSAMYTMEVADGVRKYAYSAPAVGLRSSQNPRSVYRSGEGATLSGSFVKRVARAGGFTLTVIVH